MTTTFALTPFPAEAAERIVITGIASLAIL
jgi:hypothetical protein